MLRAILVVLFLFPSFGWCPPLKEIAYSNYWKYCWTYSRHWHRDITIEEINCFCRSTWEGVQGNDNQARLYFHTALEENGLHQMDNRAGFGWGGATWPVVRKALGYKGPGIWLWAEEHPFEVNRAVAAYFAKNVDENRIAWWHNSRDPEKNKKYVSDILTIKKFCNRSN